MFTYSELESLANWNTIHPNFDLIDSIDPCKSVWRKEVEFPMMEQMEKSGVAEYKICTHGQDGHSTYFHFIFYPKAITKKFNEVFTESHIEFDVSIIYLSLLAPIAVFGRGKYQKWINDTSILEHHPGIDIDSLIEPTKPDKSELECYVLNLITKLGYNFPAISELRNVLPSDIKPYEYCICMPPWDKIFHILFSNAD